MGIEDTPKTKDILDQLMAASTIPGRQISGIQLDSPTGGGGNNNEELMP
jgi:hypothetical protein